MILNKKILATLLFLFSFFFLYAQPDEIDPNGYNIFYYPNGFKLSEGNLRDGKPDGFWITYYVNGNKKSEGNRKNFLLDSVWTFFAENADTTEVINYAQDQKNGFYYKYNTNFDSIKNNYIISKELYVNDKKQGFSFYYFPNGKIKNKIKYVDNYKHGTAYEYSKEGVLVAIEEYRYNNLVSRKAVNRYDKNNQKTGNWVEVFDNGKVKSEINYVSGLPNGSYKEFSPTGKLLKVEKFENGVVVASAEKPKYDTLESANLRVDKDYYSNGNLKTLKIYKDSIPFGTHIYYNEDGSISNAISYDEFGIKNGEGLVDTLSKKQGIWKHFYTDGKLSSKGEYKDDKKIKEWVWYFESGEILQKGNYNEGLPDGSWTWYFETGNILRQENYFLGARSGKMFELSPQGDTIVKGQFDEGDKMGNWFYRIGDEFMKGEYYYGQKTGIWTSYYYPEMKLECVTEYSEGKKSGKHKCYYKNKKLKEQGVYIGGEKNEKWNYFYEDGILNYTAIYKFGELIEVNDVELK